jgi:hypothetical protein
MYAQRLATPPPGSAAPHALSRPCWGAVCRLWPSPCGAIGVLGPWHRKRLREAPSAGWRPPLASAGVDHGQGAAAALCQVSAVGGSTNLGRSSARRFWEPYSVALARWPVRLDTTGKAGRLSPLARTRCPGPRRPCGGCADGGMAPHRYCPLSDDDRNLGCRGDNQVVCFGTFSAPFSRVN